MNFYLVEIDEHDYDQYDAFVVAASTEIEAVTFLKKKYPSEKFSEVDWESGYKVTLLEPESYREPTEILGSFNAG